MLHSVKKLTAAALLLLLAAFGCKREALTEQNLNATTGTPEHKVQQWLNAQPKPTAAANRTAGSALPKNKLQWGQARYSKNSATHFIPAALLQEGAGNPYVRAGLVATEDAQGQVSTGYYMVALANRQKMGDEAAQHYNLARLYKQEPPTGLVTGEAGFSGSVVYYNTSGQQTASRVYDNGQIKQGATAVLTAKPQPAGSEANKLPRNCDGPGQEGCIDWYWQTFVDGVLVEEEYQFTTCCNSSSGGGAITNDEGPCGSPVVENPAYQSFLSLTETNNDPSAMAPSGGGSANQNEKRIPVTWKPIYGTWGSVTSIEEKVLEPYNNGNQYPWKFKEFIHKEHALAKSTGISLTPHNVELSLCSFTPNISHPYVASMRAKGLLRFYFCGIVIGWKDDNFDRTQSTYAW